MRIKVKQTIETTPKILIHDVPHFPRDARIAIFQDAHHLDPSWTFSDALGLIDEFCSEVSTEQELLSSIFQEFDGQMNQESVCFPEWAIILGIQEIWNNTDHLHLICRTVVPIIFYRMEISGYMPQY